MPAHTLIRILQDGIEFDKLRAEASKVRTLMELFCGTRALTVADQLKI